MNSPSTSPSESSPKLSPQPQTWHSNSRKEAPVTSLTKAGEGGRVGRGLVGISRRGHVHDQAIPSREIPVVDLHSYGSRVIRWVGVGTVTSSKADDGSGLS